MKLSLTIDCDELLKPDTSNGDKMTFKTADECIQHLHLDLFQSTPTIHQIKISCIHTCGEFEVDKHICLRALWSIGDRILEQRNTVRGGREASYIKWMAEAEGNYLEPDARLEITID